MKEELIIKGQSVVVTQLAQPSFPAPAIPILNTRIHSLIIFHKWANTASFSLFSSFQKFTVNNILTNMLIDDSVSNPGPLWLRATALATVQQPHPSFD